MAGPVPRSKSWLNRALILKSLLPELRILDWEPSEADGEDVLNLSHALTALATGARTFHIGESGTGLRFLLARLAIENGDFRVTGSRRLMQRPHGVLISALAKLGATIEIVDPTTLEIRATGGPREETRLEIDSSESSQFASSLLLVSLGLSVPLKIAVTGDQRSTGYFDMTRVLVEGIKKGRKVLVPEADVSSVATLAMIAVAGSTVLRRRALRRVASHLISEDEASLSKVLTSLEDMARNTQQPDRKIFDILRNRRAAMNVDLGSAPDLFPCLAALSVFFEGTSTFSGAPHLRLKESDRISGTAKLLKLIGIECSETPDGLIVHSAKEADIDRWDRLQRQGLAFQFDPESDHRLAFAAAVLAAGGVPIEVLGRGVVGKSFPRFWSVIEGDAPRVALIGHRGAGKTEAARRWAHGLGPNAITIDLDREIERLAGRSVQEVFDQQGEVEFRWFEREAWREVDAETRNSIEAVIVSCGGGFDPSQIDDSWIRVWLRRGTDADGRIFLDRPRLKPELSSLEESLLKWAEREPRFRSNSDRSFEIPEGVTARIQDPTEKPWVEDLLMGESAIQDVGGTVTLLPHHNVKETCERWLRWGVSRIEIRNDLFPPSRDVAVWSYLQTLPALRFLVSFRDMAEIQATLDNVNRWLAEGDPVADTSGDFLAVDWAVDGAIESSTLPPDPLLALAEANRVALVLSYHGTVDSQALETSSLVEKLKQTETTVSQRIQRPVVMKLALKCEDFEALMHFHAWLKESESTRVFLPMTVQSNSANRAPGRWTWYRLLRSKRETPLQLAFWREDDGSSLDQPTFSAWWRRHASAVRGAPTLPVAPTKFAAILGAPVHASQTPMYHHEFFRQRAMWVANIHVERSEIARALPFLFEQGLVAAAVTSPLKTEIVPNASINTLAVSDGKTFTTSTDDTGFEKLWLSVKELAGRMGFSFDPLGKNVAVWGGGGVLSALKKVIPDASFFSASTGSLRSHSTPSLLLATPDQQELLFCDIVVWASGQERGHWPAAYKPRVICDLSYIENSMARAVAIETGARYVSGLEMFCAQAEAQQEFWSRHLPVVQELK